MPRKTAAGKKKRREAINRVATVAHHGGKLVARLLDIRDHLLERLLAAMERLANC